MLTTMTVLTVMVLEVTTARQAQVMATRIVTLLVEAMTPTYYSRLGGYPYQLLYHTHHTPTDLQQITVKSREDPDEAKRKRKHRLHNDGGQLGSHNCFSSVKPPTDQDQDPQHQNPSLPCDRSELESINSPIGSTAPMPSRELDGEPPATSRNTTPPLSAKLPAHPWPPAPLAPGVDPKTPKTANKVYDNIVATMLNEAQHKFECRLFVENAYPNLDTQIRWSIECWEAICAESQRYFELSKEMRNLVRDALLHSTGSTY